MIAAALVLIGMFGFGTQSSGLGDKSGNVTIKEAPAPSQSSVASTGGSDFSARKVYKRDGPGVVSVDVASKQGAAGGSGFVLDKNGHIVTNQHVVEGADGISVQFANGARKEAKVVGQDPSTDVALLKVDAPKELLAPLTLGDSKSVGVGEPVVAIGNPLNVGISVTSGIVSAIGRPIKAPNNYTISNAVQTDAAINPGNSGGPLLDSGGTVIGINAQIASQTGASQGVGFAIPINTVKTVVKQLGTTGKVEHGYIGVKMFPAGIGEIGAYAALSDETLKKKYGLPSHGAIVSDAVKGSPAEKAGISGGKEKDIGGLGKIPLGDVITEANGEQVETPDDVINVVNNLKPGDRIKLTVVTPNEKPRQVEVKLATQPRKG